QSVASHTIAVAVGVPGEALRCHWRGGPDLVIECTGAADVWKAAPSWVAGGGRVLLFGGLPGGAAAEFDATRLHYGEVDLIGAFHYCTADVLEALHLLASGTFRPGDLITAAPRSTRSWRSFPILTGAPGA